ncbi:hypothetical protein ACO0K7_19250 [Undibacterium sp. Ji67W]|uniref:hypothetical protein n=1 Tax=Undibacterium sp. Ji67W TaxID=3413042 RepID=UPI003BF3AA8B
MEPQQQLGVLLTLTEQQSQTTEKLLRELQGQIAELGKVAMSANRAAASAAMAAQESTPALEKAIKGATREAVTDSLTGASEKAVAAVSVAAAPVLQQFSELTNSINQAKNKLDESIGNLGWKWMVLCVGIALGMVAFVAVVVWSTVWYQRDKISTLTQQKEALQTEVAELQVNVDKLAKKGGRIKITNCEGRLCIEVNRNQGATAPNWDRAEWHAKNNGVPLVIPMGY